MSSSDQVVAGRALLEAWRAKNPRENTMSALAGLVGVSQPAVSAWLRGDTRPDSHYRDVLEVLLGIPRTAWDLPAERAAVKRLRSIASAMKRTSGRAA